MATCMLQCCGSLQCSRLPLARQQATTNQLQLKQRKWIALHLWAIMGPLFSTHITYMHSMHFCCKRIHIQVTGGTVLTSDVFKSTTTLQSVNNCVNALFKDKLQNNTVQMFYTHGCILIGQIQLLALWFMGQDNGHYVQQSLHLQYHNG